MHTDLNQNLQGQFEQFTAPARKLFGLSVDHAERLTQFQLAASKAYFDLAVAQFRGVTQIGDAQSFQDYMSQQQEVVSTFGRKVSDDVETLTGLNKDYAEAAGRLAQENVVAIQSASTPKAKQSA